MRTMEIRPALFVANILLASMLLAETPTAKPVDHPLSPALKLAQEGLERIDKDIRDYTCLLLKRELIDGALSPYQFMQMKLRHRQSLAEGAEIPFAVYLKFLKPVSIQGREVLFVDGQRNGDMLVRRGGVGLLSNITVRLSPTGRRALNEGKYPVTQVGIRNLINRLIEVMEQEQKFEECDVKFFDDAKLDGRLCQHIQVTHPTRRSHFQYHLARVFIDKELQLPVYFASYNWPLEVGDTPELLEEYIYTKVELNKGLTDQDFESTHPDYQFQKERTPEEAAAEEAKAKDKAENR